MELVGALVDDYSLVFTIFHVRDRPRAAITDRATLDAVLARVIWTRTLYEALYWFNDIAGGHLFKVVIEHVLKLALDDFLSARFDLHLRIVVLKLDFAKFFDLIKGQCKRLHDIFQRDVKPWESQDIVYTIGNEILHSLYINLFLIVSQTRESCILAHDLLCLFDGFSTFLD